MIYETEEVVRRFELAEPSDPQDDSQPWRIVVGDLRKNEDGEPFLEIEMVSPAGYGVGGSIVFYLGPRYVEDGDTEVDYTDRIHQALKVAMDFLRSLAKG